jgi:hypothetical protein
MRSTVPEWENRGKCFDEWEWEQGVKSKRWRTQVEQVWKLFV